MGPSGSGKSTLLNLAGGLDAATSGQVLIEGQSVGTLKGDALARLRRRRVGFVFQDFNLIPSLTAVENVALPLELDGQRVGRARRRAMDALVVVGVAGARRPLPGQDVGRPAAAGRHRPRPGRRPPARARRRAHRRPRLPHRRGCAARAAGAVRRRGRRAAGHPRGPARRLGRPGRVPARRRRRRQHRVGRTRRGAARARPSEDGHDHPHGTQATAGMPSGPDRRDAGARGCPGGMPRGGSPCGWPSATPGATRAAASWSSSWWPCRSACSSARWSSRRPRRSPRIERIPTTLGSAQAMVQGPEEQVVLQTADPDAGWATDGNSPAAHGHDGPGVRHRERAWARPRTSLHCNGSPAARWSPSATSPCGG